MPKKKKTTSSPEPKPNPSRVDTRGKFASKGALGSETIKGRRAQRRVQNLS